MTKKRLDNPSDLDKLRGDVNSHEEHNLANNFRNFDEIMADLGAFIDETIMDNKYGAFSRN